MRLSILFIQTTNIVGSMYHISTDFSNCNQWSTNELRPLFCLTGVAVLFYQAQLRKLVPTIIEVVRDIPGLPTLPHFFGVTSQKAIDLLRKTNSLIYEVLYHLQPILFMTGGSKEVHVCDRLPGELFFIKAKDIVNDT